MNFNFSTIISETPVLFCTHAGGLGGLSHKSASWVILSTVSLTPENFLFFMGSVDISLKRVGNGS